MPAPKSRPSKPAPRSTKAGTAGRMSLEEVLRALEQAGSEKTRKTYTRLGAQGPLFGVAFGTLFGLVKRIGVDHDLALALWDTENVDARNLAYKVADPRRLAQADLERWGRATTVWMFGLAVSMLAAEGPRARTTADRWLASKEEGMRTLGWGVVAQLAARDAALQDAWFAERLAQVERSIHQAANRERYLMNSALIAIGGRSPAFRTAALAASKRIGKVQVDHGDNACKTPDATAAVEKAWAYARSKGFDTPAAQERAREVPRLRC